jgi:hypothetical protein
VYQLCVNKGKLWSVTATTSEKRWEKRKDLYGKKKNLEKKILVSMQCHAHNQRGAVGEEDL